MRRNQVGGILTAAGLVCLAVAVWVMASGSLTYPAAAAPDLRCVCTCDGESAVLRIETEESDGEGITPIIDGS
jgi:hypothetical protein